MTIKIITACLLLPCVLTAQPVQFRRETGKVEVLLDGRPFTAFHYEEQWDKPFLHPLRTADGLVVSRGYPLEKIEGESNDHIWHRGIWWAHGDVNGADFWRERGRDKTGRLVVKGAPKLDAPSGALSATLEMLTPEGKVLGSVSQAIRFTRVEANAIIDVTVAVLADRGIALKLGDTEEGALGIRLADAFREDRGATLVNSDGLTGAKNIWGKRARWVDYSTTLQGQQAGVAAFDHPSNPQHPTWWHARGYALNAANPFGERDFTRDKSRDGSVTVPSGGRLEFRYRVVIHPGDAKSADIEKLYQSFAATPAGSRR